MANAANRDGNPTSVSADLRVFYTKHVLGYQQAHPEDVSELLCSLCQKKEPPPESAPPKRGLNWGQVWLECADCGVWLHRACARAEGTIRRVAAGAADGERQGRGADGRAATDSVRGGQVP